MRVAGIQQRHVRRGIGLAARMRLHVGVVGAEQALDAIDGQLLDHVDVLAATVVALAGIAFGVLVGQHRALGLEHARAGVVLRGDQLDVVFLALPLAGDGAGQIGIETLDRHRIGIHGIASLTAKGRQWYPKDGCTQDCSSASTTAFQAAARLPRL